MLRLEKVDPHEWRFLYPEVYEELMEEFHQGVERLEYGELKEAERVFRATLVRMPDHVDALHHLALVLDERGRKAVARTVWEEAVRIGRRAFPQGFEPDQDRLEWGWLDNRPFLRCLQGLALACREGGEIELALDLYRELLALNPGDNQGVRGVAVEALFELGRPGEVLALCHRYPDDVMPEITYGRALALFSLGRRERATRRLREAVAWSPLVAKELLKTKHRRPRSRFPGTVTMGGPDEAYDYWEHQGKFWKQMAGALEWLRRVARARVSGGSLRHFEAVGRLRIRE
ncbi:MAG: tetratricopeptide repeat protein [Candidatus Methylomirabilia bacterium]